MDNKEGNMESDLKGFGETERTFEVSKETNQKIGEATKRTLDVDKEIERADEAIRQTLKNDDPNAAYTQVKEEREKVQEAEIGQ